MYKKNGNRYSNEFKQQIVDLYHTGTPVTQLSREYGISTVAIYNWIQNLTVTSNKTVTKQEHHILKKRIIELEMENEILKKATVILAKNNNHK